jgi:hypothetical protein
MNSRHLRPWLVAIVVIVGVAVAGAARPGPAAPTKNVTAGAIAATMPGWSGAEGIMPAKPQAAAAATHEQAVRVKLPLFAGAVFSAALSAVMTRQALRRPGRPQAPLAVRVRSWSRRAPPLLSLS